MCFLIEPNYFQGYAGPRGVPGPLGPPGIQGLTGEKGDKYIFNKPCYRNKVIKLTLQSLGWLRF